MKITTRLRLRFVAVSMLALTLMLGTIILFSAAQSHRSLLRRADGMIDSILGQDGVPIGAEAHYFIVTVSQKKSRVQMFALSSVSNEQAVLSAKRVLARGEERGFYESFRYRIVLDDQGDRHAIFLSSSGQMTMGRSNLRTLMFFSSLMLLAMLGVLIPASSWVVCPMVDAYRKQKEFIASASHQLQTPLAVIRADATLIETSTGPNEWMTDMKKQLQWLSEMVSALSSFAKMEDNASQRETMIYFPISDLTEEMVDSFRPLAALKEIDLHAEIAPGLTMRGAEGEIRQLLSILLDNAVKYAGMQGNICVKLYRKKALLLEITNTASQITREELPYVFQRFYRSASAIASGQRGFGLGLAIAKVIVERHCGKIDASLAEGQFRIQVVFP